VTYKIGENYIYVDKATGETEWKIMCVNTHAFLGYPEDAQPARMIAIGMTGATKGCMRSFNLDGTYGQAAAGVTPPALKKRPVLEYNLCTAVFTYGASTKYVTLSPDIGGSPTFNVCIEDGKIVDIVRCVD
jgi:hypothetical protein